MKKRFLHLIDSIDYSTPRIITATFPSSNATFNKMLTIIDYHAPTNISTQENEATTIQFYDDIQKVIHNNQDHLIILLGDTNARLGKQSTKAAYQGKYTIGTRNLNGCHFAYFLE